MKSILMISISTIYVGSCVVVGRRFLGIDEKCDGEFRMNEFDG